MDNTQDSLEDKLIRAFTDSQQALEFVEKVRPAIHAYVVEQVAAKQQDSELLNQIIRSTMISAHVHSKAKFDNAKDTEQLMAAANENSELLVEALKVKMHRYREDLLIETLQEMLKGNQGKLVLRDSEGRMVSVEIKLTTPPDGDKE